MSGAKYAAAANDFNRNRHAPSRTSICRACQHREIPVYKGQLSYCFELLRTYEQIGHT
jgi:hypothetical protein